MGQANALWPSPEGETGELLPLNRDPQGHLHMAWPGFVRGMVNDLHSVATAPGKSLQGRLSSAELASLPGAVARLQLGAVPGGLEADAGEAVLGGALQHNIFAGVKAKTADMPKLGQALTLEGRGASPVDIHAATGWFRGPDNKWRFEIPDDEAKAKGYFTRGEPQNTGLDLSNILQHDKLYNAYPQLKSMNVRNTDGPSGSAAYYPSDQRIELAPDSRKNTLSTLLHETQHGVQDIEGHAEGGDPAQFLPPGFTGKFIEALQDHRDLKQQIRNTGADADQVQGALIANSHGMSLQGSEALPHLAKVINADPDLLPKFQESLTNIADMNLQSKQANEKYRALAGEAEAYNVQERHAQGDYSSFPPSTPGFPSYEKQIVVLDGKEQPRLATPIDHDPFAQRPGLVPVEHDPWQQTAEPVDHDPFASTTENQP